MIAILRENGEKAAAKLLVNVGTKTDATRQLAYRLYALCERKGWADDARAYNEIVTSWLPIEAATAVLLGPYEQIELFGENP